jgi:hypothetical protein
MRTVFKKILQILDGTPAEYGRKRQRGQSFVELAFITPILIIMVAGIVEIGWYANNYINLLEAAKVGARRGPFLNGENSPEAYEKRFGADNDFDGDADTTSVVHPSIASGTIPALALPTSDTDPVLNNTRYSTRGYTFPLEATSCNEIAVEQFGFYNLIVCTVLDSLDPISLRIGINDPDEPDAAPEFYQDDIVISVFSLQKVNNGPQGDFNPDGHDHDEDGTAEGTPYDFDINALSSIDYPPGHQVIVVGRWPAEANECYDGVNSLEGETHKRDPFDYIVDGVTNYDWIVTGGKTVGLPYEIAEPVYNDAGEVIDFAGYNDTGVERQRGWVLTGQRRVTVEEGQTFNGNCYGSEFSLQEVQEMMNLPRFVLQSDPATYQNRRYYIPSQGLVLVEVFWEHQMLMGEAFPLFFGAYRLFTMLNDNGEPHGQDSNVIHVWAAFPAPAAEPNIVYSLD